ncbi:MAG: DUF1007 family protein [Spirochaetales bacterium]|nr:DUF1007 family protein [Spirochaetales bacterium]
MKKSLLFLLILLLPSAGLFAHPHMFVDMKLKAVFNEDSFVGVEVDWLFDQVFTGSVLMDNNIGWKDSFTDDEIEIIKSTSFVNLVNYNYFTYFNVGSRMTTAKTYTDFTAYMKDNRLGYKFFLPYEGENPSAKEVRIAVYDKTFFTDIAYVEDNPASVDAPADKQIEWELSENKNAPIYYDNTVQTVAREGTVYSGQAFPIELVLTVK